MGLLLFIDGTLRLTLTSGRVHCSSLRLFDRVKNYIRCGGISCLPNNINPLNPELNPICYLLALF